MSWWMGAGLGFLRGGPWGALLGGVAGHLISKTARKKVQKRLPGVADENLFVTCIVVVLTQLAVVKGRITAGDVEAIYRFFVRNLGYEQADLKQINKVIEETLRVDPALPPVVDKFLQSGNRRYRSLLLTLAYQLVLIESSLNEAVQAKINELARCLGLSLEEHRKIREQYSLGELVTPYTLLDIPERASDDEVRKAFRRRLAESHPDRVMHLGEPHVEKAHIRFLEIQSAYRELTQMRGL